MPPYAVRMKTKFTLTFLAAVACTLLPLRAESLVEPGPENGGLRMRLIVSPNAQGKAGYEVRLDLVNTTHTDIPLRAAWLYDRDDGDFNDFIATAVSIETVPEIEPWMGQIHAPQRTLPQPERTVKAGETLSVQWQTDGPRLKGKVTNPLDVQNPELRLPGLYSIHATLDLRTTDGRAISLRSNEAQLSVGGSIAMPKHGYGRLISTDKSRSTGVFNIGSAEQVAVGDKFEKHGMAGDWVFTVAKVEQHISFGDLAPIIPADRDPALPRPPFPEVSTGFSLVLPPQ